MQWDSYSKREHRGACFGMKSSSFSAYRNLPRSSPRRLELALGGEDAPRAELREAGWTLVDPLAVTLTPWAYRRYIRQSLGELSVAKHGYVAARSGWSASAARTTSRAGGL